MTLNHALRDAQKVCALLARFARSLKKALVFANYVYAASCLLVYVFVKFLCEYCIIHLLCASLDMLCKK